MSDLNYSQFTTRFTAMLQSCNISNNNKYTFVHFLFQMSQVIFRVLPTIQLKMRALNTDPNHSANNIFTLSHTEYGCCYIGMYNYFESRVGDQPKMINKLSYRWVGVALASRFVNKGLVQRKFRLRFRNFHFFEPLS